jgi:hypothetical protein
MVTSASTYVNPVISKLDAFGAAEETPPRDKVPTVRDANMMIANVGRRK